MKIRLEVPYKDKDLAKAKGAKWNPSLKTWFTDDIAKIEGLDQWVNKFNIICENIYIFKMDRTCWKCKKNTEVVCLGTDKSYSTEEHYDENMDIQLLSYVESMPDSLAKYMKDQFSYFPSYSRTVKSTYYINHCSHCKSVQGDNFLHEVPEEAFYKKLCYKDSEPSSYRKIKNQFCIPLEAQLPYYDETSGSMELILAHMITEVENRSSLDISQTLINRLPDVSIQEEDIEIIGL